MGISGILTIIFVICAVISFIGMLGDKLATNRRNYTWVFCIIMILTVILNFGK